MKTKAMLLKIRLTIQLKSNANKCCMNSKNIFSPEESREQQKNSDSGKFTYYYQLVF